MIYTIRRIITEVLNIDGYEINLDTTFGDLGADSLDAFEISMAIEDEYGIFFTDDEMFEALNANKTVGDLLAAVESKVQDES
jgi:acyl carrier protein